MLRRAYCGICDMAGDKLVPFIAAAAALIPLIGAIAVLRMKDSEYWMATPFLGLLLLLHWIVPRDHETFVGALTRCLKQLLTMMAWLLGALTVVAGIELTVAGGIQAVAGLFLLLAVLSVALRPHWLELLENIDVLTARLDATVERQSEYERAERRREYEIGFLESKAAALQRQLDALHIRVEMMETSADDPEGQDAARAFVGSLERELQG